MRVFLTIFYLIMLIAAIGEGYIFYNVYKFGRDRSYLGYLFFYLAIFYSVSVVVLDSILSNDLVTIFANGVYQQLLYSLIVYGYSLTIYATIQYWMALGVMPENRIGKKVLFLVSFLPVIVICGMILRRSPLKQIVVFTNGASLVMIGLWFVLGIWLAFKLRSHAWKQVLEKPKRTLVWILAVACIIYPAGGVFNGLQDYFSWNYDKMYPPLTFSAVYFFLFTLISSSMGFKILGGLTPARMAEPTITLLLNEELLKKYNISAREKEIIEEILAGKTNQAIADSLCISLWTVKSHIYNIFQKTGAKNRVGLVKIFSGITDGGDHTLV
jgi:DNA-binding CsgD family transcriptional regulator